MMRTLLKTLLLTLVLTAVSVPGWAQASRISGVVLDAEGVPVRGALITFERTDQNGNYEVKTNKKGRYVHAGLQMGTYTARLLIDGEQFDEVVGVRVSPQQAGTLDFDLAPPKPVEPGVVQTGPTEEEIAKMNEKQREEFEAIRKQREEQLARNANLNNAFNTGMEAMTNKDFASAVTALKSAAELSPEQDVIWGNLGLAQSSLALTKSGDEKEALFTDAAASYMKAMEIAPTKPAYPSNLGMALMQGGQIDEGMAMLEKAVAINPAAGGQSYYNAGVVLSNSGDSDGALAAFKKATEVQPDYADAHYQLATALLSKAGFADGAMVPVEGTKEAYQAYLDLAPTGQFADSAKAMLESLSAKVDTTFKQ